MTARLSVNINPETEAAIQEMCDAWETSATETIRRAVSIAKFIFDEVIEGDRAVQIVDATSDQVVTITNAAAAFLGREAFIGTKDSGPAPMDQEPNR